MVEEVGIEVGGEVAHGDEAHPGPSYAHDAGEGDLFLWVDGAVVDGGVEVLLGGEHFGVADGVRAGDGEAVGLQEGGFAVGFRAGCTDQQERDRGLQLHSGSFTRHIYILR